MVLPFAIDLEILTYALLGAIVVLLIWIIRIEIKFRRILRGKRAVNLEDSIVGLDKDIKKAIKNQLEMEEYLKTAEKRIRQSVQGVHTIRFNPFKGTGVGGNQSFATAFVNEKGDGVIISSMHSRDRTSIYAKPIINLKSEYELTKEEKDAIMKAKIS